MKFTILLASSLSRNTVKGSSIFFALYELLGESIFIKYEYQCYEGPRQNSFKIYNVWAHRMYFHLSDTSERFRIVRKCSMSEDVP